MRDNPYYEDAQAEKSAKALWGELHFIKSQEKLDSLLSKPKYEKIIETYTRPGNVLRHKRKEEAPSNTASYVPKGSQSTK
jgi:hypothetical protein